jgi:hypothetical protein
MFMLFHDELRPGRGRRLLSAVACVRGVIFGCVFGGGAIGKEGGVEDQFSWGRCWGGWLLESRGQWLAGVRELGRARAGGVTTSAAGVEVS